MKTSAKITPSSGTYSSEKLKACIANIAGISNVVFSTKTSKLSFKYQSHNALESLRILLEELGYTVVYDSDMVTTKQLPVKR